MKMEIINFNDFVNRKHVPDSENKVVKFAKKHKWAVAKACLITGAIVLGFDHEVFAATGLEDKAKELYFGKFLGVAKWIIIGKGGWDTVNKMLNEDFDGAKRGFIKYLVIFAILFGLPYGLDQVQEVFSGM